MLEFEYTYLNLPNDFYASVVPLRYASPSTLIENEQLSKQYNFKPKFTESLLAASNSTYLNWLSRGYSQAYAGHQFGHFTMLGDGRAVVIGELVKNGERFDVQLKGSGPSPYSRQGDGKATTKAMLREYLISESMYGLNIPTSRSLAVIETGGMVMRETKEPAAVLTRIMKSHLRVGTFEFARYFLNEPALKSLLTYAIDRHFPKCAIESNPAIAFINEVVEAQMDLVCDWMRVGFIHGVMNTDNTAISGETFDYGPCGFVNQYHPNTVFSSIDHQGRYAFGNQPEIIQWNLVRLTEALLPLIDRSEEIAISKAKALVETFESRWEMKYNAMMSRKIGFKNVSSTSTGLCQDLLSLMRLYEADYTNTFAALCHPIPDSLSPFHIPAFIAWKTAWMKALENEAKENSVPLKELMERMKKINPVIIPRNHMVEELLRIENWRKNDSEKKDKFLEALTIYGQPYQYNPANLKWMIPPSREENQAHQTFCGT